MTFPTIEGTPLTSVELPLPNASGRPALPDDLMMFVFARDVDHFRHPPGWTANGRSIWRVCTGDEPATVTWTELDNLPLQSLVISEAETTSPIEGAPQTPEPESAQADPGPHGSDRQVPTDVPPEQRSTAG